MSTDDFTEQDPFALFIDRLSAMVGSGMHTARITDEELTYEEIRTDVLELLGDREELAEKIAADLNRKVPYSDTNETFKGILSTLDYLFGPEAS